MELMLSSIVIVIFPPPVVLWANASAIADKPNQAATIAKYSITLTKIEYESLICKAFVIGGVLGLVLTEGIHSFQVTTDMKAAARKFPKLKEKGR